MFDNVLNTLLHIEIRNMYKYSCVKKRSRWAFTSNGGGNEGTAGFQENKGLFVRYHFKYSR